MAGANGQPAGGKVGSAEERVSTAALLAAMELIRGMSDNPAAPPGDQLMADIQQAGIRPEELTEAFAAADSRGDGHPNVWRHGCGWAVAAGLA